MQNETGNPTAIDTQRAPEDSGLSQATLASLDTGREALEKHLPAAVELNRKGKPKGKPGRPITSGKWAKKVPVGSVVQDAGSLLLEDNEAPPAVPHVPDSPVPFDKEAAEPYAEGFLDLLQALNSEATHWRVLRKTKNKEVAEIIANALEMQSTPRKLMKVGALGLAEKYQFDLAKFPESALIGGFLLWQAQTSRAIDEGIEKYFKLRAV